MLRRRRWIWFLEAKLVEKREECAKLESQMSKIYTEDHVKDCWDESWLVARRARSIFEHLRPNIDWQEIDKIGLKIDYQKIECATKKKEQEKRETEEAEEVKQLKATSKSEVGTPSPGEALLKVTIVPSSAEVLCGTSHEALG